jgi:NADH-quinone oxidoreductase subunit L
MLQDRLLEIVPWAILLLPLAGFVVLSLLEPWFKKDHEETGAGYLACATAVASFGLALFSVARLFGLLADHEGLRFAQPFLQGGDQLDPWMWIQAGGFRVPFSLLLDPLSSVMILVVTGIGSLIHIYSLGYMAHDPERVRFFSYLNLFLFFMLLLVLGGNLPLMFVGWEGVGLCSYLLIGFWYQKNAPAAAGNKAFIVNRIGDAGLILGMVFAFRAFGTLDFVDIADNAGALARETLWQWGPATITCLLLFVGATGKSAQIPLQVWLPDAMEGPTPVSALIHAATMVTAGVYLVCRMAPLYHQSETAMVVVATIGAVTLVMAATIAMVQTDIKKVLAYSTVSQLGYMFLAAGVGAFGAAIFHLFTHAFFKALLFLGSGSVIHAMSGEQDMRRMGGLRKKIPVTFWTFLIGTAAIAGLPPFAGHFSKDEILLGAWSSGHTVLGGLGFVTAALTAYYMGRLVFLTFYGPFRGTPEQEHHLHESPWSMLLPLVVLAVGSATVGFVRIPTLVQPAFRIAAEEEHHVEWIPVVAILNAVLALALAFWLYVRRTDLPGKIAAVFGPLPRIFENKWGFDFAYDWFASRVVVDGSRQVLWKEVDARGIDGLVNGVAQAVGAFSARVRLVESGLVRAYALAILGGAVALLGYLLWS